MALLKDQRFYELCQVLQIQGQTASDPDRKAIEKAFRRLALKTHPDKVSLNLGFLDLGSLPNFNPITVSRLLKSNLKLC